MDLPLFPLHTVLCPGIALPLHVFEPRYRLMVQRCLAADEPFGVIWIREGREVGGAALAVASVGTMAEIREADRLSDGRYELVSIGTRRFRLEEAYTDREPYLVGRVAPIEEVVVDEARAVRLARLVTRRFVRYVDQVRELAVDDEAEAEADEAEAEADEAVGPGEADADEAEAEAEADEAVGPGEAGADAARDEPDDARGEPDEPVAGDEAARARLTMPADPTLLSHLLSGIVELDLPRRQALLEAPTTEVRLATLAAVLAREVGLLRQGLRVFVPDARTDGARRN